MENDERSVCTDLVANDGVIDVSDADVVASELGVGGVGVRKHPTGVAQREGVVSGPMDGKAGLVLARLDRLEEELRRAVGRRVGLGEFGRFCAAYNVLAADAGEILGARLPERLPSATDRLLSGTGVRNTAVESLAGLVQDAAEAVRGAAGDGAGSAPGPLRCIRAGGRPCQMHGEIDPHRFGVFFALPFRDPPTCKAVCNALAEWLERERGMEEKRMFRADRWVSAGDFVCKICKAMQESELVVADITKRNANVYFELGLAIGMSKPVILLRDRGDEEKDVGSDLLALEYVEYDGREPEDAAWLRRFGVVFDGVRKGAEKGIRD